MNTTLRERLIRAEQHFLLAVLSNDEESLKVFSREWSQLAQDIASVKVAGHLDDDTALLISQVSRALENVSGCMLESGAILQEAQTRSISEFIQDISSDPDPSSITSPHPQAVAPYHLLFSNHPSSMTPSILGQHKPLDSFAYRWLRQNIHNPYPSSVQMRIIRDVSGTSTAQIELWFQEIRDSIGWSKLSHDFFAGSVNATVAAARRVYLERDRDISFDIVFAFTAVKASVETLFSEHPALRGKDTKASAQAIPTVVMDQHHHMGPFPDEPIIESEGIIVPPQVDPPVPLDPFSDLSDSDESEEEDTTPPPPIAGCKRPLTEDVLTSQMYDMEKPQKRRRTSIDWTPYSKRECHPPSYSPTSSPLKSGVSSEQTLLTGSASLVSRFPSLRSSPIPSESLPGPPPVSQKRSGVGLEEATPEGAVSPLHTHISAHGVRKRKLSQCVSPMPFKRQCRPSVSPRRDCTVHPTPIFDRCPDLYPSQGGPTDLEAPQSTLQISDNPDASVNFGVFDWNSIPDPLTETVPSLSQPAVVYVPSSDLTSQLLEPQDFGPDAKTTSRSLVDLGPLGDLGSLLQFPTPPGWASDLSTSFSTSPHSGSSPLPPQDFDWSSISEFIDSFTPDSTQSLTSSGVCPSPPESSQEWLYQSQSFNSTKLPSSVLDPSVPPSVFLPLEPGSFSDNMDDMWSFLRDGS